MLQSDREKSVCSITLSANAGISVCMDDTIILVDALHNTGVQGYSTLNRQRLNKMRESEAFQNPAALVFTHCHEDHFSRELAEEAMQIWPHAELVLPEYCIDGQILLKQGVEKLRIGGLSISMLRIRHEGAQNEDVPNYACVISRADGNYNILVLGDAELGNEMLLHRLEEAGICYREDIDIAVVDFPWICVSKGRRIIDDILKPEHLVAYHIPFEEDDIYRYRSITRRAAVKVKNIPDIRIMDEFLQTEFF